MPRHTANKNSATQLTNSHTRHHPARVREDRPLPPTRAPLEPRVGVGPQGGCPDNRSRCPGRTSVWRPTPGHSAIASRPKVRCTDCFASARLSRGSGSPIRLSACPALRGQTCGGPTCRSPTSRDGLLPSISLANTLALPLSQSVILTYRRFRRSSRPGAVEDPQDERFERILRGGEFRRNPLSATQFGPPADPFSLPRAPALPWL